MAKLMRNLLSSNSENKAVLRSEAGLARWHEGTVILKIKILLRAAAQGKQRRSEELKIENDL